MANTIQPNGMVDRPQYRRAAKAGVRNPCHWCGKPIPPTAHSFASTCKTSCRLALRREYNRRYQLRLKEVARRG